MLTLLALQMSVVIVCIFHQHEVWRHWSLLKLGKM